MEIIEKQEDIIDKILIHRGLIRARWLLIAGLSILGIFLKLVSEKQFLISLDYRAITSLIFIASSYNIIYLIYLRRGTRCSQKGLKALSLLQIIPDILIYSSIIYLTGGISATGFVFYLYSIITASALYRAKGIILAIFLTIIAYSFIVGLEYYSIIPHFSSYSSEFETFQYKNYAYTFVVYTTVIFVIAMGGGFSSAVSQILERRNASIKKERDRVDSIIDHLPDSIILINNNHQITFANNQAINMFKIPKDSLINLKLDKNKLKEDPIYNQLYKVFFPSEKYRIPSLKQRYEIVLTGQTQTILKIETILVMEKNKQMLGFMKVIHNITREKAIDKMKSEFISIAAHQLRTPLSAIKWSLKMVLDGDLGKASKEVIQFIQKSYKTNERMIRLVNDLLNVSRIEEGRFVYKFNPLNLIEFCNSVVSEFKHLAEEKNIKLIWQAPKNPIPLIKADGDRLRLAIQNILDNSLKYTDQGSITLSLERLDGLNVKISIKDTGFGIPSEEQHRIFTKFYRGNNALKRQTEGSGLGLFIVKNIIDKHDAKIDFTSSSGGSIFNIYFKGIDKSENDSSKDKDNFKRFLTEF